MINKAFWLAIALNVVALLLSVVNAAMNIKPVSSILFFCAHAIVIAALFTVRDWGKYKPSTNLPRYYFRNKA